MSRTYISHTLYLSPSLGDALSTKAENEYILTEREREKWEFENAKEGEIKEMVDLYVNTKGMDKEDAELICKTYAKYPDAFVDLMMKEELELQVPGEDDNPWLDGFVTFSSFVFFGAFPLLSYAIFGSAGWQDNHLFIASCIMSAVMFFLLGALKTKFTTQHWLYGGFEILVMGVIISAVAYGIGAGVEGVLVGGATAGNGNTTLPVHR